MKILFVVPYVPSLVRIRPYFLIRSLSECGHQVTVMTLWSDEAERKDIARLEQICHEVKAVRLKRTRSIWNSLRAVASKAPLQSAYSWNPELAAQIRLATSPDRYGRLPYDVVHIEHLRGARYGLQLLPQTRTNGHKLTPPVVWDSVDCISHLFRQASKKSQSRSGRMITKFEVARTENYEAWLATQFDQILLTSPRDLEAFRQLLSSRSLLSQNAQFTVLPNGVDLDYFQPDQNQNREPFTLVISGKMSYHANSTMVLHLVQEILPRVWAKRPEVRLVIVGKDPGREILALNHQPRIEVTGTVEDLRPYLQRAAISVAPIAYGTGIQNKVLEAMACATPVITSPIAMPALQAKAGKDLLVAGEPEAFADAILSLLNDAAQREKIGASGRAYVTSQHNWKNIAAQLAITYQASIDRMRRRTTDYH